MQIPIPAQDRTFFGFYFKDKFYVFKRLPFGFVNNMKHFNVALDLTMARDKDELRQRDLLRQGG